MYKGAGFPAKNNPTALEGKLKQWFWRRCGFQNASPELYKSVAWPT
jgi:hypothetical protein